MKNKKISLNNNLVYKLLLESKLKNEMSDIKEIYGETILYTYGQESYTDYIFGILVELEHIAKLGELNTVTQVLVRIRDILNKVNYKAIIESQPNIGELESKALNAIKNKLNDDVFFSNICKMGQDSQFLYNDLHATLRHRCNHISDKTSIPNKV